MSNAFSLEVTQRCKVSLIRMKEDLLNRVRGMSLEVSAHDKASGDEIDQTVAQQQEDSFVASQNRMRLLIMEIDFALAKIQKGKFGICEETEEPIETDRLMALPYTRLSLEGAELREGMKKKYAW